MSIGPHNFLSKDETINLNKVSRQNIRNTENLQIHLPNCNTVNDAKKRLTQEVNGMYQDVFIKSCLVVLKYDNKGYQADINISTEDSSAKIGRRTHEYKVNNIWIASYRKRYNNVNRAVYTAPLFENINNKTIQLVLYISTKDEESIVTSAVSVIDGENKNRGGFHHIISPNLFRGSQGITFLSNRVLGPNSSFNDLFTKSVIRYYEQCPMQDLYELEVTTEDLIEGHLDLLTNQKVNNTTNNNNNNENENENDDGGNDE